MRTSEKVDQIIPALLNLKKKLQAVSKDTNNPFYKSKYATLEAHLLEVEPLLAENDLVLLQPTKCLETAGSLVNVVESSIFHKSGQFVSADLAITNSSLDAQKVGASVTYFRRFTLGSLLGMVQTDDDGNSAVDKTVEKKTTKNSNQGVSPEAAQANSAAQQEAYSQNAATQTTNKPSFRRPKKEENKVAKTQATPEVTSNGDDI